MYYSRLAVAGWLLSSTSSFFLAQATSCRYLPGDAGWPSASAWRSLNATVDGNLIATVPLGSPCHDPNYDAAECALLQSEWLEPQLHMLSSSSAMAPFFANQSCDPFTPESQPCLLGNYVDYAINVSCIGDVVAGVKFAAKNNIRLVIRNTGHDYLGKSTGAGALGIWTRYLKDIEFGTYKSPYYSGSAIKMGAGVQAFEAYEAATPRGLVVIGGECPTVGVAGGYTQGGGHSALASTYGLGADQVLEWEVVLADGSLVTASRTQNTDLYWALSGGGGGTYGVVVSLTAKTYKDSIVSGASLVFYAAGLSTDTFYAAIEAFHVALPAMVDTGAMVVYYFSNAFFEIDPITSPGKTAAQVTAILSKFTAALQKLGVPYTLSVTQNSTYYDHYNTYFGPAPYGNIDVGIAQYGGRLIPRSLIQNNVSAFTAAVRNITENGVLFIGVGVNVSSPAITSSVNNAVLPAWRSALVSATLTTPWSFTAPFSDMIALQDKMTYEIIPQLEAITPTSGCYLNEADFRQPNFQQTFYGANYNSLLSIKNKYDPNHLFYAVTAVGSEAWSVASNGRMCRT